MAKTGIVLEPFRYAADGVTVETLAAGRVLSFPDLLFDGLKDDGFVGPSDGIPENSVTEAESRDAVAVDRQGGVVSEIRDRLKVASDQDLKDIIARSGVPVSGNLVHADLMAGAIEQLRSEADGKTPVRGVDPNAGVTEQPLATPGAPTPPSTVPIIEETIVASDEGASPPADTDSSSGEEQTPVALDDGSGASDGPMIEGEATMAEGDAVALEAANEETSAEKPSAANRRRTRA